jgi:hypothetical protein
VRSFRREEHAAGVHGYARCVIRIRDRKDRVTLHHNALLPERRVRILEPAQIDEAGDAIRGVAVIGVEIGHSVGALVSS